MGSRPYRTKGGRTMPCSIFPSKNSRPGLESAIFLFRDSHGGTEGALKQRQSSAVWEQAREWRKSSRIERPRVGAARRADLRFRRERAVSPNQILPQSRRDAGLSAVLHHIPKPHTLPARAVEERERGPVGIGLQIGERWKSSGHAVALKVFSNSLTARMISSKSGTSPKNMGPSMAW